MMDLRKVAAAYGGTGSGNQCNIPTPGHSRSDLGTSITLKSGAPDGLLVKCHNGSDADALAVKDMLRRDGFLTERQPRESGNDNGAKWRCTGTYEYDDGDGQVIYRTRRLERTGNKKRFIAERFEGGAWVSGLDGVERLPYRFTELCRAAEHARESGEPQPVIYFTEGERKADKLAGWGFLATAIAFGCKGWRNEYGEAFRGLNVVILPDNDEPGRKFADTVAAGIEAHGGTAFIVELPGLPPKGDVMDWRGTADDLRALTGKALARDALPFPTLDLAALALTRAKEKEFAIERIAPLAEVTLFTGPGSAGKSLLGQQLATAAAAGLTCLGLAIQAGPALYLTCEDDADQLHWRQEHLCTAMGVDMASLAGKLHLVSLRGEIGSELAAFTGDGKMTPTAAFQRLTTMMKVTGAKLAFLDNVAHLFTGNENDRGDVTRFVNLLNKLAGETGAAIVLLGHPNKQGDEWSGSTAWPNAVRSRIYLEHDEETDLRALSLPKANYGKKGDVVSFRWHNWAFVRDEDLPADTRAEISQIVKANGENAAFLRCLATCTDKRRAVSHNPGSNYAPKVFAAMPESKSYTPKGLAGAMERLLSLGTIALDQPLWRGPNRVMKQGIKLAEICTDPPAPTPRTDLHETRGNPARFNPPIDKSISGADSWPAAPDDDLDWGDCGEGDE